MAKQRPHGPGQCPVATRTNFLRAFYAWVRGSGIVALAVGCMFVILTRDSQLAHAETGDQFVSADLTLALPGNGEPSFITFEMLMADDGSGNLDARAAAVHEQLLSRFPGAVPVTDAGVTAQYLLTRYKWLDNRPSWSYNPAGKPAGLVDDATAVDAAAASWGTAGANVTLLDDGNTTAAPSLCQNLADGRNTVGWAPIGHGVLAMTCTSWSPLAGAIEFDMQIDPSWAWTTNLSVIRMDLQTVVTHEFGHALGLDHPCDFNRPTTCSGPERTAVMYGSYTAGENRRTQQADDIAGILAVYGPSEISPSSSSLTPVTPQATLRPLLPARPLLPYRNTIAGISPG